MIINRSLFYLIFILFFGIEFSEGAEPNNALTRPNIRISIRSSRPVVPADSNFGIFADITNASPTDIFFKPKNICISPPPELDPEAPSLWWSTMIVAGIDSPPNFEEENKKSDEKKWADKWEKHFERSHRTVRLGAGDTATVFWGGVMSKDKEKELFYNYKRVLNFMPGEYLIKVVALYWLDEKGANEQDVKYYTANAEAGINFIAPQHVIIIGAIFGGIIAFIILPSARSGKNITFYGFVTSMLLSVIVTVLLSRISDSQFFLKISVNDFWGSVAIGFIANATGLSIIKKYLPTPAPELKLEGEAGKTVLAAPGTGPVRGVTAAAPESKPEGEASKTVLAAPGKGSSGGDIKNN